MKRMSLCMIVTSSLLLSASPPGEKKLITQIRQAYYHIENGIKNNAYRRQHHSEEEENIVQEATIYIDKQGRVVKLRCSGGSEDSAHEADYYYRPDGTIFFAYLRSANVAECKTQLRIYFDAAGRPVRRLKKEGKKCGYAVAYPEKIVDPREGYRKFCEVGGS